MNPLVAALVLAQATIYSWTDEHGVEHFTDNAAAVPKHVKVRTTDGAEVSRVEGEVKPVRPAVLKPQPVPQFATEPALPAVPSASEQHWRQAFRELKGRIAELKGEVEADRQLIEGNHGLPQTARFSCLPGGWFGPGFVTSTGVTVNGQPLPGAGVPTVGVLPCVPAWNPQWEIVRERLDRNRRALARAREELVELERRASFEAVPLHWRR